jgi:hypothetical protein
MAEIDAANHSRGIPKAESDCLTKDIGKAGVQIMPKKDVSDDSASFGILRCGANPFRRGPWHLTWCNRRLNLDLDAQKTPVQTAVQVRFAVKAAGPARDRGPLPHYFRGSAWHVTLTLPVGDSSPGLPWHIMPGGFRRHRWGRTRPRGCSVAWPTVLDSDGGTACIQ